ncbi:DUF4767 domain-containing protein [Lactobacillus sp. PSON]|uniref:DUF4767 domain-containing protein n=1 Tax=Lactobacillus sp. PSON TaxID=3455454 RepID=UPI0040414740
MNKKIWVGVSIALIAGTLSGCGVQFNKEGIKFDSQTKSKAVKPEKDKTSKKISQSSSTSSSSSLNDKKATKEAPKKAKKKTVKKSTKNKISKKIKHKKSRTKKISWNNTKAQQLASFVTNWSTGINQVYQKYDGTQPLKTNVGTVYPDVLFQRQFLLNGQNVTLSWSPNLKGQAEYKVVAIYNDNFKEANMHYTYLFCFHNNKPVILLDQGGNTNPITLIKTKNSTLQTGFANIANQ